MGRPKGASNNVARDLPGHSNERRHHLAAGAPADELMPAIFFLTLPPDGETGIGAEARSKAERDDVLGYSGHLSFHRSEERRVGKECRL